jgi:hypothetical protein
LFIKNQRKHPIKNLHLYILRYHLSPAFRPPKSLTHQ